MSSNVRETREQVSQLKTELAEIKTTFTDINNLFTSYISLAYGAGLRGDIMDALRKLQQLRIALQLTLRSIQLFYTASGPVGWAMFGVSAAATAISVANLATELES